MPGSSSKAASGPQAGGSSVARDSLEAQLALAEKEVSMVMDAFEYDELITIASEALALRVNSPTPSKDVIKSRKNLLWARSHSYHHKGLHALALKDARAALKLDPDNPASFLRTAVLLHNAGHKAQALGCLDRATSLADSYDPSTKAIWRRRVDKQRQKFSASSVFHIDCLPNEVLIAIARHLPHRDRLTMSQSCHHWRQLTISDPSLWDELIVPIKSRPLSESKAARWLDQIRNLQRRANNALKSANFKGLFPGSLLREVLGILRLSAQSLEHISIPAADHELCYRLLYRYCPNLKSLNVFGSRLVNIEITGSRFLQDYDDDALPEPPGNSFMLEKLHCDVNAAYPSMSKHLINLRSLKYYVPEEWDGEGGNIREEAREEQINLLLSLSDSLEEWYLADNWPSRCYFDPRIPHRRFPPVVATFSKLKTLNSYILNANFRFDFPELLGLESFSVLDGQAGSERSEFRRRDEAARLLNSCPKLHTLGVDFGDLDPGERDLFQALRGLQNLGDLSLFSDLHINSVLKLLLPFASGGESAPLQVAVPFPKLCRLTLIASSLDVTALASVLLERDWLRQGHGQIEAKRRARESLSATITSLAPLKSPFQRGTKATVEAQPESKRTGPHLVDLTRVCALKSLTLFCLRSISTEAQNALRGLVPSLELRYVEL